MTMLGRYRVEALLHRGGMGEIFLARTTGPGGFERSVVIKRLKDALNEDPPIRKLFEREAFLLARLHHPNIVRAIDYFFHDGAPHLVLEHIQGRNLRNVAYQSRKVAGSFPLRYGLYVTAQLLRGLHYTHHARGDGGRPLGITHRDICPSNVMVSYFGEVKVADFGIASMAGAQRLTSPGYFRGKVQYAAPEQMTGESGGVASDVYSAGVVLAELISGRMLFKAASAADTVRLVLSENRDRTVARVLAGSPQVMGLRAALRGALAVAPSDRFESALQFAEVLESIAKEQRLGCTPAQLGLFMRRIYDGDPELPVDDAFDWKAGSIPTLHDGDPPPAGEGEVESFAKATRQRRFLSWLPFGRSAALLTGGL
jgi:serine/threonine-protein kinase